MAIAYICQGCGIEAPSKYVEFYYNIGALVIRYRRGVKGNLCKRCIHKQFWKCTLMDLTLGWWGTISFFITPIFFVNNVVRYLGALTLKSPEPGAAPPRVQDAEIKRLAPYAKELVDRLNKKEALEIVALAIARQAGVTPGQVALYLRLLAQAQAQQVPQPLPQAKGFPVMPPSLPPR